MVLLLFTESVVDDQALSSISKCPQCKEPEVQCRSMTTLSYPNTTPVPVCLAMRQREDTTSNVAPEFHRGLAACSGKNFSFATDITWHVFSIAGIEKTSQRSAL